MRKLGIFGYEEKEGDSVLEMEIDQFLQTIEFNWRKNLKMIHPLYWKIPLEWNLKKKLRTNWTINTLSKVILIEILANKSKLIDVIRKHLKFQTDKNDDLIEDYFQYWLFHYFYHIVEAPFSDHGENNDKKLLHKAIWDGIAIAEPKLSSYEILQKVIICHSVVKDFIIDNRLFLENLEFQWFLPNILLDSYYNYLYNYKVLHIDFFLIISIINTVLYASKDLIPYLENNFKAEALQAADKTIMNLIKSNKPILITQVIEDDERTLIQLRKTNRLQFIKQIRRLFQGESRYESITRLVTSISPYITQKFASSSGHSNESISEIISDIFDQFSMSEQSSFVKDILDSEEDFSRNLPKETELRLEIKVLHEFYLRNHPFIEIKGELGLDKTVFHKGNNYISLKKADIINIQRTKHINLENIDRFQKTYGLPMLIPLEEDSFILNEYELKHRKSRNIRYKVKSGREFDVPDVLEIYIDKTGSMFFEEDKGYRGWNDGSRYDNSVSVLYGFVTTLFEQAKKQKKKCFIRIHSFSEIQINSPLITLQEFLAGDSAMLKVLFEPENGYEYENLNIEIFNDGLKRVYVIISDGDLVIEGRTDREAKKLIQISQNPLNKVILFEMEKRFSLGRAIQNNPFILTYTVHDKESMFYQGMDVILPP